MKPTISQAAIEAFDSLSQNGFNKFGSVKYSQTQNGAEAKIEATGSRNFYNPQEPIDAQTIVGIGSITKQFTAATLLKL